MFEQSEQIGGITVLSLRGKRLPSPAYPALEVLLGAQVARKAPAVLLDCTGARAPDLSTTGALLEIYRRFAPFCQIAICGLPDPAGFEESSHPITAWLPFYPTREAALAGAELAAFRLADWQAIVLASPRHPGPPSHNVPLSLLPVFGTSLLHRVLEGLHAHGIAQITLDCGPDGGEIRSHAQQAHLPAHAMRPYNNAFSGPETGSALLALQRDLSSFDRPAILVFGNASSTADLPALLAAHKASGATVSLATIAGPAGPVASFADLATCKQAFTGIAVFSAGALEGLAPSPGRGLFSTLLPDMMRRGQSIARMATQSARPLVSDSAIYFDLLREDLSARISSQHGRMLIVEPGARLSRRAQITGPCYIGKGAEIAAGCHVSGPTIIEPGCKLGRGTEVRSSVITSLLTSGSGGRLHNVVAAPGWELPITAARQLSMEEHRPIKIRAANVPHIGDPAQALVRPAS